MNPTIRQTRVLDYYDGVLVFTAECDDGQQYVGTINAAPPDRKLATQHQKATRRAQEP